MGRDKEARKAAKTAERDEVACEEGGGSRAVVKLAMCRAPAPPD